MMERSVCYLGLENDYYSIHAEYVIIAEKLGYP